MPIPVHAATVEDMAAAVRQAGLAGVPVAVHATAPLVIVTGALRGVRIDPVRRRAQIQPGARFEDVRTAAAPHGLTVRGSGSVTGAVVGGALAATAIEVVTTNGYAGRAARPDPGSAAITWLELELEPTPETHA